MTQEQLLNALCILIACMAGIICFLGIMLSLKNNIIQELHQKLYDAYKYNLTGEHSDDLKPSRFSSKRQKHNDRITRKYNRDFKEEDSYIKDNAIAAIAAALAGGSK